MAAKQQAPAAPEVNISVVIEASPAQVLRAFFDADALGAWWQVARSVTTPRMLGAYAIEWKTTDFRDDVLGRLGGTLRGTVMQYEHGRSCFIADLFWLPPDGEPIGPMAFEVTCTPAAGRQGPSSATQLRVVQTGYEEGPRWRRYYEIFGGGLERAVHSLKMLLEK